MKAFMIERDGDVRTSGSNKISEGFMGYNHDVEVLDRIRIKGSKNE